MTTLTQPEVFRLFAARAAIRLEKLGLKHSRGSVRRSWAIHFGLGARASCDAVIARLTQEILAAQLPELDKDRNELLSD